MTLNAPPPWIRQWICRDDAGRFFHKRCLGVADGLVFSSRSFYSSLFYSCKLNETELAWVRRTDRI